MATVDELNNELFRLSRELGRSCNRLEAAGCEYAIKENDYRKAKATAFLFADGRTVDAKKAEVDLKCENERLACHIAAAARVAAYERVKSLRAQLSALQTIAASTRVELETLGTPEPLPLNQRHPEMERDEFPF